MQIPGLDLTKIVGTGKGLISIRLHKGSYPPDNGITSIGTNDPAKWAHLLWFEGEIWVSKLYSDVLNHVPTFEELHGHCEDCRYSSTNPWRRVPTGGYLQ